MTRLVVNSGGCGYHIIIRVEKVEGSKMTFLLRMATECKHVRLLGEDLPTLEMFDALKGIFENPVYRAAARRLKHAACPVPSGILKALEVEAGLNVPRDVTMVFDVGKGDNADTA